MSDTTAAVTGIIDLTAGTITLAYTPPAPPVAPPGAPTNVVLTAGNGSVTATFTPPANPPGPITGYTLILSSGQTFPGNSSPITANGLPNGVAVTATVTATDSGGTGPASAPSNSVTPTAPVVYSAPTAPTGLTAIAGVQSAEVSGTVPTGAAAGNSPVTSITVTASTGQTASGATFPINVTGLTAGTAVTFTATCTNAYGTSPASVPSAAVTPTAPATGNAFSWSATAGSNITQIYAFENFGNYNVNFDDWGVQGGTLTMAGSGPASWTVTATKTTETDSPGCYPHVSRGWEDNASLLAKLGSNWTTASGMGILVSAITKVHVKWNITTPTPVTATAPGSRWDALIDVYFHTTANPASSAWYPEADLQIMQMGMDQYLTGQSAANSGYYAYVYNNSKSKFRKTIGGNTYAGAIQLATYNQSGGVTVTLFPDPFLGDGSGGTLLWGKQDMIHDLGSIIAWLASNAPTDDSGNVLKNASGVAYTGPVINPAWYLTAVNAGFEIDFGTGSGPNATWTTNDFWCSVQNETDPTT